MALCHYNTVMPVFAFIHCWQLHIVLCLFLCNKTNRRTNFPNLFCQETLHVSGSSSAHHQEFSTVHSALVYVIKPAWRIPAPNVQWKIPDDGQRNCSKACRVSWQNKFGKLVRLLVLFLKNCYDARSHERKILCLYLLVVMNWCSNEHLYRNHCTSGSGGTCFCIIVFQNKTEIFNVISSSLSSTFITSQQFSWFSKGCRSHWPNTSYLLFCQKSSKYTACIKCYCFLH